MMEDEVAERDKEIEERYKRMAIEEGFYRDANTTAEESFLAYKVDCCGDY